MNIGTSLKTISKNQLCSFVGTGGYVELAESDVLSDGNIVTAAVMLPLLNSGNDKGEGILPPGYQKMDFLESTGTQFIDTGIVTDGTYTITATLRGNNVGGSNDILGRRGSDGASFAQRFSRTYWLIAFYYVWGGQLSENQLNSAQIHDYIVTEGQKRIIVDGKSFNLNALNLSEVNASNPRSKTHYLFAANGGSRGKVCFYSFRMQDGAGQIVLDFVPALDLDGTPCMFDTVKKQPFYNAGTGAFRVGIATLQQARELQLPDNTGNAVRTLYVSLPQEARTDFIAQKHLSDLTDLNWSINAQYRDGDIPADYTKVDFLESTGTQYIETQIEVDSAWGAKVEWEMTKITNYANVLSVNNADLSGQIINAGGFSVPYWNGVYAPFYAVFMNQGEKTYFLDRDAQVGIRYTSELNFFNSRQVKLNTESLGVIPETVQSFPCKNPILFGSSRNGEPLYTAKLTGKIFRAQISKDTTIKMDLVPVINTDGVPGMWDKVNKQFYENSGTGAFIVGIKTLNDTRLLDKALPAVPHGSTYSISVSLPVEASTDAPAQKALKDLSARGWNITVQYREDEIPAGYAKVAFLESSGEQNICVKAPELRYSQMLWSQEVDIQFLSDFKSLVGFKGRTGLYWGRFASKHVGVNEDTQSPTPQIEREKLIFTTRCITVELSYASNGEWKSTLAAADGSWKVQRNNLPGAGISQDQPFGLFRFGAEHTDADRGSIRIWSCKCWCDSVSYDLIPVINTAGVPGMWDRVNKQFYENDGTGQFRVGLASKEAVRNLYLEPDVPTGTTIDLSVPAGTTDADTDILKANNPNYTFNIQYRS